MNRQEILRGVEFTPLQTQEAGQINGDIGEYVARLSDVDTEFYLLRPEFISLCFEGLSRAPSPDEFKLLIETAALAENPKAALAAERVISYFFSRPGEQYQQMTTGVSSESRRNVFFESGIYDQAVNTAHRFARGFLSLDFNPEVWSWAHQFWFEDQAGGMKAGLVKGAASLVGYLDPVDFRKAISKRKELELVVGMQTALEIYNQMPIETGGEARLRTTSLLPGLSKKYLSRGGEYQEQQAKAVGLFHESLVGSLEVLLLAPELKQADLEETPEGRKPTVNMFPGLYTREQTDLIYRFYQMVAFKIREARFIEGLDESFWVGLARYSPINTAIEVSPRAEEDSLLAWHDFLKRVRQAASTLLDYGSTGETKAEAAPALWQAIEQLEKADQEAVAQALACNCFSPAYVSDLGVISEGHPGWERPFQAPDDSLVLKPEEAEALRQRDERVVARLKTELNHSLHRLRAGYRVEVGDDWQDVGFSAMSFTPKKNGATLVKVELGPLDFSLTVDSQSNVSGFVYGLPMPGRRHLSKIVLTVLKYLRGVNVELADISLEAGDLSGEKTKRKTALASVAGVHFRLMWPGSEPGVRQSEVNSSAKATVRVLYRKEQSLVELGEGLLPDQSVLEWLYQIEDPGLTSVVLSVLITLAEYQRYKTAEAEIRRLYGENVSLDEVNMWLSKAQQDLMQIDQIQDPDLKNVVVAALRKVLLRRSSAETTREAPVFYWYKNGNTRIMKVGLNRPMTIFNPNTGKEKVEDHLLAMAVASDGWQYDGEITEKGIPSGASKEVRALIRLQNQLPKPERNLEGTQDLFEDPVPVNPGTKAFYQLTMVAGEAISEEVHTVPLPRKAREEIDGGIK